MVHRKINFYENKKFQIRSVLTYGRYDTTSYKNRKAKSDFSCSIRIGSVLLPQSVLMCFSFCLWFRTFWVPSYIYIYIYIYIYVCIFFSFLLVQRQKKVNISKWIGLQRDLYSFKKYLFSSYEHFQLATFVKELLVIFPVWRSVYIGVTVLMEWLYLLISW